MRLLAAVGWVALTAATAGAQEHYAVDNTEWNGVSNLAELAASQGFTIEPRTELDWSEVKPGDVLFLVYPKTPVEPAHLMSFLRGGGRLLIADDYGTAKDTLARLKILRSTSAVHADRYHENNDALPVAKSVDPGHPLSDGISELYTNHPGWFTVEKGPEVVFSFNEGEALVVAGRLDEGRFVALGDPSVLINGMMAFDENAIFASNLLAFLAPPEGVRTGRIILLTQQFSLTGEPPDTLDEAQASNLNGVLRDFDKFLDEINDYLATKDAIWGIGVAGATIFLVGVALLLLPIAGQKDLDGSWTRARTPEDRVDFEKLVAHFDDPRAGRNYAYPAAVLRESIEMRLSELSGTDTPFALPADELLRRVQAKAGRDAAMALHTMWNRFLALPTRAQAAAPWGTRHVNRREFEIAHDLALAFEAYCSGPKGS